MIAGFSKLQLPLASAELQNKASSTAPAPAPSLSSSSASSSSSSAPPGIAVPLPSSRYSSSCIPSTSTTASSSSGALFSSISQSSQPPLRLRKAFVENLVDALANAGEILDVATNSARLIGFDASQSELDLCIEPDYASLALLSDRAESSSSLDDFQPSPSGGFRSYDGRRYRRPVAAGAPRSLDRCPELDSEEDFMLQEARRRAFRDGGTSRSWRSSAQTSLSNHRSTSSVLSSSHHLHAKDNPSKPHDAVFNDIMMKVEGAAQQLWTFTETISLQCNSRELVVGVVIATAFCLSFRLLFSKKHQRKPSVKRRILRSHWYGDSGHRNFQMRISELPKTPILEVDGDKQILRPPYEDTSKQIFRPPLADTPNSGLKRDLGMPMSNTEVSTSLKTVRKRPPYEDTSKQIFRPPLADTPNSGLKRDLGMPMSNTEVSTSLKTVRKPIRQSLNINNEFQRSPNVNYTGRNLSKSLNGKNSEDLDPGPISRYKCLVNDNNDSGRNDRVPNLSQNRRHAMCSMTTSNVTQKAAPLKSIPRRNVLPSAQKKSDLMRNSFHQNKWGEEDELDLDKRIKKLYQTVQSVEQHRRTAMLELAEERQRSVALEEEMAKQKAAAEALKEEVRLLKESHNALLMSLRRKYSSSAAARAAADLVYQDLEGKTAKE